MNKIVYRPSPKAVDVRRNADLAKFRLLDGAVRSGKSYVGNDIAIREIQALPPCDVLVSGYSISSVARNIIAEWKGMIDPKNRGLFHHVKEEKDDYIRVDWRGLRDKKFYVRGAGKEHDFKQIQGATFGYWLGDELTRQCESFVDMAMTRLSPPWAKALFTTNSDSPYHFVKTRFVDDVDLYVPDESGFSLWKRWTFFLQDNPSLTYQYIDSLKRMYTGVFYKRYIESLWVAAEGVIYDFFDEDEFVISRSPETTRYVVGIDYGTGNPTSFILFGLNPDPKAKLKIWAEREYWYDSKASDRQKTDSEYSADLRDFLNGIVPEKIIVDPSAASFKVQLRKDRFTGITDADNSVLDGIRTQARMLKNREYLIRARCKETIKEYLGYVWDKRVQEKKGEDKPLKQHDHTKDAERYVLQTLFGKRRIDYHSFTSK